MPPTYTIPAPLQKKLGCLGMAADTWAPSTSRQKRLMPAQTSAGQESKLVMQLSRVSRCIARVTKHRHALAGGLKVLPRLGNCSAAFRPVDDAAADPLALA